VQQTIADAERVLGNDGRVVVRLSGTESVARVMLEDQIRALSNLWRIALGRLLPANRYPLNGNSALSKE